MSKIQLFLSNTTGVYYPGNTVKGALRCYFDSEETIKAITITCIGREKTRFSQTRSHQGKTEHVICGAENKFFNKKISLLSDETKLPLGMHDYSFSFALPSCIPSTFDTDHGKVTYTIKATVDRPWKINYKAEIFLTIISLIDLNIIGGIRSPIEASDEKNMCCCCCKSGPLSMTVNLPRAGYAPGETVHISVHVENLSNVNVNSLKFTVAWDIILSAAGSTKVETTDIGEATELGVRAHSENDYYLNLQIVEDVVPSNFINCRFLQVRYYLKCVAVCSLPHKNLTFSIPLQMGHVGLERSITTHTTFNNVITNPDVASGSQEYTYCLYGKKTIIDSKKKKVF